MMKHDNSIEDELNTIRIALYKKTKNMSYDEFIAFVRKETEPINKKYGLRAISSIDEEILKITSSK
jgi:hypothetical protein